MRKIVLLGAILLFQLSAATSQALAMPADIDDPREKAYTVTVNTFDYENLKGIYEGFSFIVQEGTDFNNRDSYLRTQKQTITITEQNLMLVKGTKSYYDVAKKQNFSEDFNGVVTADGKKIYIAEKEDGYNFIDIVDQDTLIAYYVEAGSEYRGTATVLKKLQ